MIKSFTLSIALLYCVASIAQSKNPNYAAIDEKVKSFGALASFNVATIADTITRPFADKESKARAIFYWISHEIAMDGKAMKINDQRNVEPEKLIATRKGTPLGFSKLFQEMCSYAKIRCLSIDGYLKTDASEINEPSDEFNHSWNVVQLDQSPDKWYYVDACKASGYLDKKMTTFTRDFTEGYFFADRTLFNFDHYPDNKAWLLGKGGPGSLKDFYAQAVISPAAYDLGMGKPTPLDGLIKTKTTTPVSFRFPFNGDKLQTVGLLIGEAKRQKLIPMNFTYDNNTIAFTYTFKEEDEYPVAVMVNGKELIAYKFVVAEK